MKTDERDQHREEVYKYLEDEHGHERRRRKIEDKENVVAQKPLDYVRGERRPVKDMHERNGRAGIISCHGREVLQRIRGRSGGRTSCIPALKNVAEMTKMWQLTRQSEETQPKHDRITSYEYDVKSTERGVTIERRMPKLTEREKRYAGRGDGDEKFATKHMPEKYGR